MNLLVALSCLFSFAPTHLIAAAPPWQVDAISSSIEKRSQHGGQITFVAAQEQEVWASHLRGLKNFMWPHQYDRLLNTKLFSRLDRNPDFSYRLRFVWVSSSRDRQMYGRPPLDHIGTLPPGEYFLSYTSGRTDAHLLPSIAPHVSNIESGAGYKWYAKPPGPGSSPIPNMYSSPAGLSTQPPPYFRSGADYFFVVEPSNAGRARLDFIPWTGDDLQPDTKVMVQLYMKVPPGYQDPVDQAVSSAAFGGAQAGKGKASRESWLKWLFGGGRGGGSGASGATEGSSFIG
ncbi:MAG: hypothetical protein M1833_004401 [Piccolia ochrophora]|nr:MAG: hypothetical protein M1833_004401 [Piccolia ochrophora]